MPCSLALVGFGRAGQLHYGNLLRNIQVQLCYIFEIADALPMVRTRLKQDEKENIAVVNITELQAVLSSAKLDGIMIASPSKYHAEHISIGLHAGLPVYVEKPVTDKLEDAVAVYKLSKELNIPLYCSFQRRWDPTLRQLISQAHAGQIGKLHLIKSTARDHPPVPCGPYIRSSGGFCLDSAVHDIDLLCYLAKEYPISVFVKGHAHDPEYAEIGDVDTLCIVFKYASGLLAIIDMSRGTVYGYDQRVEAFGDRGMLLSGGQYQSGLVHSNDTGEHKPKILASFQTRYREAFENSLDHYLHIIKGKTEPITKGFEMINVAQLAALCTRSLKEGKELPFVPVTALDQV